MLAAFAMMLNLIGGAAAEDAATITRAVSWPLIVQQDLVRLGQVEWRLRTIAASACPARAAGAGVIIDDLDAYDDRDRDYVWRETGLHDLPEVLSTIQGGPADRAGIGAGDQIVAINDVNVMDFRREGSASLADAVQDRLSALPVGRKIDVQIMRGGRIETKPLILESVCGTRAFLKTDGDIAAFSDGSNVAVSSGLMQFAANDDELALILGHEMAHVMAYRGEPAGLFGRRKSEDRADLIGAALAHCAGYDVAQGLAFWTRYANREATAAAPDPSYRSPAEREDRIRNALTEFSCPVSR